MNGGVILAGFGLLITLATIAVVVSQNAQSANIIQALGTATATSIGAATAPVTGATTAAK
jgi:hypothetical protein